MCKDIEHGGERCSADTSEARRFRRKTSKILASSPTKTAPTFNDITPFLLNENISKLKEQAEDLKKKIYGDLPEGETQNSWDAKNEQELTNLGFHLGFEAEQIANHDPVEIKKHMDEKKQEMYSAQEKLVEETHKNLEVLYTQWVEILEKYKTNEDNNEVKFEENQKVQKLTPEQKALLTDEEREFVSKYVKLRNRFQRQQDEFDGIDDDYAFYQEKYYTEANIKLAAAYQEVLAQIRPLGGKINYDNENSNIEAEKLITETVGAHYPSEWLQKHNEASGEKVAIKFETNQRPFYAKNSFSETEDDGIPKQVEHDIVFCVNKKENMERVKKLFKSDSQNNKVSIVTLSQRNADPTYIIHVASDSEEIYSEGTHGTLVDGKPAGEGWKHKTSIASIQQMREDGREEEGSMQFLEKKVWVKPMETTAKRSKVLTVFSDETLRRIQGNKKTSYDKGKAVAYHEFGHRMEEVLPNNTLPRLEKAFLARRSGKTEDNWYENMRSTGATNEYGHDANLVINYAGREYFTNENYEVFTVGIESLYGGAYGGLVGNTKDYLKTDSDHRGFVLGSMAVL